MNTCVDFNDAVKLDSLLRHVLPTVNNLPYELGVGMLREAYIKFATETECLAAQLTYTPQKDVADYELTPPEGYEIYKVRIGEPQRGCPGQSPHYWCYAGERYYMVGNKTLVLESVPSHDATEQSAILVTVIPTECATRIPREISVPFGESIAKGALAEALLLKNKAWYDPNLSSLMQREFGRGIQRAKNLNLTNRGAMPTVARGKRWV